MRTNIWDNVNSANFNYCIDWDITQDTPIELLHTVLLGIVKYVWRTTHVLFKTEKKKKKYATRLQATQTNGLSTDSIQASYITQYANSLIGRQLKIIAQVNVFHVYDIVPEEVLALTRAVGELCALLWFPEIRHMEEYLVCDIISCFLLHILSSWELNLNKG